MGFTSGILASLLTFFLASVAGAANTICASFYLNEHLTKSSSVLSPKRLAALKGRNVLVFTTNELTQTSGVPIVMRALQKAIPSVSGAVPIFITPKMWPKYREINFQGQKIHKIEPNAKDLQAFMDEYDPVAVHIMNEYMGGNQIRKLLMAEKIPFSTGYHTEWRTVFSSRLKAFPFTLLKPGLEFMVDFHLRRFHGSAQSVMVPSPTTFQKLINLGYKPDNLKQWSHGVDLEMFRPVEVLDRAPFIEIAKAQGLTLRPGPIVIMVSRFSDEKNVEDFGRLNLDHIQGNKFFIGPGSDGDFSAFRAKYPDVIIAGPKEHDKELPILVQNADAFVFTGYMENMPLIIGEALASGTPVVAYNAQGQKDIITSDKAGVLVDLDLNDPNGNILRLQQGLSKALQLDRKEVREFALGISWDKTAVEFLNFLHLIPRSQD